MKLYYESGQVSNAKGESFPTLTEFTKGDTSDNLARYTMVQPPSPNFILAFDDMGYENSLGVQFEFTVKKTGLARAKYWLLCKFFPFKIVKWDK